LCEQKTYKCHNVRTTKVTTAAAILNVDDKGQIIKELIRNLKLLFKADILCSYLGLYTNQLDPLFLNV
jgi:hypothetical protein